LKGLVTSARRHPARLAEWFSRHIGLPLVVDSPLRRAKARQPIQRLLREKLASQFWPLERQLAQQLELVKRLLEHAGQQVPYYRDLFRDLGFDPRGVRSLEDLQALPVLSRQTVQAQDKRLLADNAPAHSVRRFLTGGTTGVVLQGWQDPSYFQHAEAAAWMSDMAAGRRIGTRTAYLWGEHRDNSPYQGWRGLARRWLRNEYFFNNHYFSDGRMLQVHDALQAIGPGVLVAWASSAARLASFLEREGLRPRYPRLAVIASGDVLDPEMRAAIQRVFPTPIFDRYGSVEVGLIAYECQEHSGLHLNLSNVYLECLGPDVYSRPGEVIITQLRNYAMPLIRYQVDDLAVLARQTCTCGRDAPMLERVAGRRIAAFVATNGTRVEGDRLLYNIRRTPGVLEFQLIQEDIGRLRLLLKTVPDFDPGNLAPARADLANTLGADCELIVEQVERIPLPPSGKPQILVSKLDSAAWDVGRPVG
jgi:phenylacetate-CoA ligase